MPYHTHQRERTVLRFMIVLMLLVSFRPAIGSEPIHKALTNGLELVLFADDVQDKDSAQPIQVWLQIHSGSVAETDAQRGAAIMLQHASPIGTATMDQESINELFAVGGYSPLLGEGSFTHFDQTTIMLPAHDAEDIEQILHYYKDLLDAHRINAKAFAQTLTTLSTKRSAGPRNNQEIWIPQLLDGLAPGERLPLPDLAALELLTLDEVNAFADQHYRPSNATIIVVGSFDPASIAQQITRTLGTIEAHQPEAANPSSFEQGCASRVEASENIGSDRTEVALLWFYPISFASMGDGEGVRRVVVEKVASELVRHRINAQLRRSMDGIQETDGSIVNLSGNLRASQIVGTINTDEWDTVLTDLCAQTARLVNDPISDDEFTRARRTSLQQWRSDQIEWASLDTHRQAATINWIVAAGLTIDPAIRSDRASSVLATITNDEIHRTIKLRFNLDETNVLIVMPKDTMPSAQSVQEVFGDALRLDPDPLSPVWLDQFAPPIIASIPYGGEIREISQHTASGVWTGILNNSIIVRQRTMNDPEGIAELRITLHHPHHPEGDATVLDAATSGWWIPSTTKLSAGDIRAILAEFSMSIRLDQSSKHTQLIIRAPDAAIDRMIELGYVLISNPEIDPRGFAQWQAHKSGSNADEHAGLIDFAIEGYTDAMRTKPAAASCSLPGDVSRRQATMALHELTRASPIEIAIVGASDAEETLEKVATFFGTLSPRPAPTRRVPSEIDEQPIAPEQTIVLAADDELNDLDDSSNAGVVVGLIACEDNDLACVRAMIVASMVLGEQIDHLVSTNHQHDPDAQSLSPRVYFDARFPGQALLLASIQTTSPEHFGDEIERLFADLARTPIPQSTLTKYIEIIDNALANQLPTAEFWATKLSILSLSGQSIEDVWVIREAYLGQTPQSLQQHFAQSMDEGRHLRIEIHEQD
ncbi:MAG: insulinase family protein [Phycisphaerales bacterium]|nr:insulinase family protein [Phycisphaerales bacterium]